MSLKVWLIIWGACIGFFGGSLITLCEQPSYEYFPVLSIICLILFLGSVGLFTKDLIQAIENCEF